MSVRMVARRLGSKLLPRFTPAAYLHSHATSFGFKKVDEEEKSQLVGNVFTKVASNYDIMNDLMSGGLHRLWKERLVTKLNPFPGMKHLDVAGGTGDVAFRILETINSVNRRAIEDTIEDDLQEETQIYVCDINPNMLNVGKKRAQERGLGDLGSLVWVITKLPDELLTQILSLLPDKDANRTRILSNRWNHLCAFLPSLRFVMPSFQSPQEATKFHDFVDQTFALRGHNMPIKRFFLSCSKQCDYNRLLDWLRIVVKCKVQEIELRFPPNRYKVMFCWDLFKTCNTLVELTLEGEFVLDVPLDTELLFPCLKKISLLSVVYSGDESVENLISGCPVLEELYIERQAFFDMLQIVNVSSPSLKRLTMCFSGETFSGLMVYAAAIDTPNLEYLHIDDIMSTAYRFTKMPSLVEAYMSTSGSAEELITCLSPAKTLTLTYSTLNVVTSVHGIGINTFPNLGKLVIGVRTVMNWNLLLRAFLEWMPNLEHLTFLDDWKKLWGRMTPLTP